MFSQSQKFLQKACSRGLSTSKKSASPFTPKISRLQLRNLHPMPSILHSSNLSDVSTRPPRRHRASGQSPAAWPDCAASPAEQPAAPKTRWPKSSSPGPPAPGLLLRRSLRRKPPERDPAKEKGWRCPEQRGYGRIDRMQHQIRIVCYAKKAKTGPERRRDQNGNLLASCRLRHQALPINPH